MSLSKTPDFTDNLLGIVQCQGSLEDDPENTPLFVSIAFKSKQ